MLPFALVLSLLATLSPSEAARQLLEEKRPSEALVGLEEAIAAGGLDEAELRSAYELMGRAHGMLGRGQQAQRAFAIALRLAPSFRLEDASDPEVRGPFEAALAALPPEDEALLARAQLGRADGPGLAVALVADDMDLVASARVLVGGERLTTLELPRSAPGVFYPLDYTKLEGPLEVRLLDAYGNELKSLLVEVPLEDAAAPSTPAASELRWLALGGGTLLGLGAVGVTVAGVWFAALDGGNLEAPEGAREVGLASVGMATGVIALGGVLVVVDALLNGVE